jgi:hypothetical protein
VGKKPKYRLAEEEARAIATAFLLEKVPHVPVIPASERSEPVPHVPQCDGSKYESGQPAHWVFLFKIPMLGGWIQDPSHWIVLVDCDARTAEFFPVM